MCTRCGIILQQRVYFSSSLFPFLSDRPPGARLASHFLRTGSGFAYGNRKPLDLKKTIDARDI